MASSTSVRCFAPFFKFKFNHRLLTLAANLVQFKVFSVQCRFDRIDGQNNFISPSVLPSSGRQVCKPPADRFSDVDRSSRSVNMKSLPRSFPSFLFIYFCLFFFLFSPLAPLSAVGPPPVVRVVTPARTPQPITWHDTNTRTQLVVAGGNCNICAIHGKLNFFSQISTSNAFKDDPTLRTDSRFPSFYKKIDKKCILVVNLFCEWIFINMFHIFF